METAVLLTCHGTVDRAEDIAAFVTNIRRGRPAPAEVVDEVRRRFERIGGSPLMRITRAQGDALAARLGLPVAVAGRLWRPYPAEVLTQLHEAGVRRVVSLPLAPQSVDVYHAAVREAAAPLGLELACAPAWGLEPALIDAFVETIDEGLAKLGAPARDLDIWGSGSPDGALRPKPQLAIVLSAHSLPQRVIDSGDLYERQFRAMAAEVEARIAPRGHPVAVAFQSQGMTGDVWLGPDLPATFARLAAAGAREVLVAPIGFVADHVETLYDLEIEARAVAQGAGLRMERAEAVNARPRFIDALEAVVRRALA